MHPSKIVVSTFGRGYETWPNLVGVFQRAFPIACGMARNGQPQTVTYYDQRYTIGCRSVEHIDRQAA